jgi:hypothetical protein
LKAEGARNEGSVLATVFESGTDGDDARMQKLAEEPLKRLWREFYPRLGQQGFSGGCNDLHTLVLHVVLVIVSHIEQPTFNVTALLARLPRRAILGEKLAQVGVAEPFD